MPVFVKGGANRTPFGKNVYLRSTRGTQFMSYTVAASTITAQTIDTFAGQKILQPGTVMAKITSGTDTGKIGPYQKGTGAAGAAAVNEVQQFDLGAASAGTFTVTFDGQTTAALAYNVSNANLLIALQNLPNIDVGDVTVGGGTLPGTAVTLTFAGQYAGVNVPQITVAAVAALTGGTITVATNTQGSPATLTGSATDGRGDPANIVGINDTFLPWQLIERDVEVAVLYKGTCVQAWCYEYTAAGVEMALTNTTADALRSKKTLDVLFY